MFSTGMPITLHRVWDRKSKRHNWQLIVNAGDPAHAQRVLAAQQKRLSQWGKWPDGQLAVDHLDLAAGGHDLPCSLPANAPMDAIYAIGDTLPCTS